MIKVSVLYPNGADSRFDIAYYCDRHMPMVREKLGAALKDIAVDEGIGGAEPGSKPSHLAVGHLTFDSVEAFRAAFGPHAGEILGDIPNYTNVQPVIQINQIRQVRG